jgi:hypothetical protein
MGTMPVAPLPQPPDRVFDAFLSHAWGTTEHGHDGHALVLRIAEALKARGVRVWVDAEQMPLGRDIPDAMATGIRQSGVVVCFLTRRYLSKAVGDNEADNCRREFKLARQIKRMVAVPLEEGCLDPASWPDVVRMEVGDALYPAEFSARVVGQARVLQGGPAFEEQVDRLAARIRRITTGALGCPSFLACPPIFVAIIFCLTISAVGAML